MTLARDVPLHEGVALNRALLDFLAVDFSQ
jgi:hypothetical protein